LTLPVRYGFWAVCAVLYVCETVDTNHDNTLTREEVEQAKDTLRERFRERMKRQQQTLSVDRFALGLIAKNEC
jgi:hypothetical protein